MPVESKHPLLSDEELVRLYLGSHSQSYFDAIYERYARKVYQKCLSMLQDEDAAQDALQDIFLKIYTSLAKFNEHARFTTWVYAIAYNYCIDYSRRVQKERGLFADEPLENVDDSPEEVADTEILTMKSELLPLVLSKIPMDDKTVLLMKYQDGFSIKDICDILDKSESAVKMQIKRAKVKAKSAYQTLLRHG